MSLSSIIEENDQTRARREHLEEIRRLVGNAYPSRFTRTNVTATPEGEDTITALADHETIKRIVGDESFTAAFDALEEKSKSGARPAPEDLAPVNEKLNAVTVRVAGRLATPPRVMGKAAFVHLSDGKTRLQIYVRRDDARAVSNDMDAVIDEAESGWRLFNLLDHGDFVGVEGFLFVTKTGELSIHVRTLKFLAKALLPMPDKMHGVADPEIRQRQRYVDLLAGSLKVKTEEDTDGDELTPREVFERRSHMIREMRRYLDDHGYVEVETPILSPLASGAAARPFKTHHNALGIDLYARIAPELYLKRLLVGGFERVYELNRNFRNEGIDRTHNPEFTMLEFYSAYMDANGMMDFCEEMLRTTIENATGSTRTRFGEEEIDFGVKFEQLTMKQAVFSRLPPEWNKLDSDTIDISWLDDPRQLQRLRLFYSILLGEYVTRVEARPIIATRGEHERQLAENFDQTSRAEIFNLVFVEQKDLFWKQAGEQNEREIKESGEPTQTESAKMLLELFEYIAEGKLTNPTFITDFPKPVSPLSKASPANPSVAERFELFILGMECANGFSELNDPEEQLARFDEQMTQRERGDEEAMQKDVDYVRALAYGMPPAAGIGIGIDRLAMLLTNRRSIRDVILFPHMRPQAPAEKPDAPLADEQNSRPN